MVDTLAVEDLYNKVEARFVAESTDVSSYFGWREPSRLRGKDRIVWVPGDDGNGGVGALSGAVMTSARVRNIATLKELITIYVHGRDPDVGDRENEFAQYKHVRLLFDAFWRAVYLAGGRRVRLVSNSWVTDKTQRRSGATLRLLLAVESAIPDLPFGTDCETAVAEGTVDADYSLNLSELDLTENISGP